MAKPEEQDDDGDEKENTFGSTTATDAECLTPGAPAVEYGSKEWNELQQVKENRRRVT